MVGLQYASPNKRVIAVLAAAIVFGIAWRVDMVAGIGLMVLALPYPRGTVFGNSNFALILLLLVIWLLRYTQQQAAAPRRTPLDMPIAALSICYIVSFYSIDNAHDLNFAFQNFLVYAATILMFYLVVNNVRTSRDLQRLHLFQAISMATVLLMTVYELNHPGEAFIPGWIEFTQTAGTEFNTRNVRVGGPFFNYELLSEYCAMGLIFIAFLIVRARGGFQRFLLGGLFLLCTFILFTTVTRGSFMALGIGLVYLLWLTRRHLQIVPLVIVVTSAVAAFFAMNTFVASSTRSGDVVARFSQTHFIGGVPDSRVGAWADAWERFLEHPIIGRGPYYSTFDGLRDWFWPHSLYLYVLCIVGLVGLAAFLWLLWKILMVSRPNTDDVRDPSYASAFLLIAHVMLVVFLVDEIKIEYLRNTTYQFVIWVFFASIVAAARIARKEKSLPPPSP